MTETNLMTTNTVKRLRKVYSLDSIIDKINEMETKRQEQIKKLKEDPDKNKNYLSNYIKHLKKESREMRALKNIATRAFKTKRKRKVNPDSKIKSGFLKKCSVSDSVIKFTGWDKNNKYSRNDVTKFICAYIKEHKLQDNTDRRKINPDKKLSKLLGYNAKKDEKLTYCGIQKCMKTQQLFVSEA